MSDMRYFDLKIPAPRRLALMRAAAAIAGAPKTWRDVRSYTLGNYAAAFCTLSQGKNGARAIWYAHVDPRFRGERFADEIANIRHKGWFTGLDDGETMRGIVARLPHGRFIAGYYWAGNGERIYYPDVHDDERDAALMADEYARVFAEREREYQERCAEACSAEDALEEKTGRLREVLALRNRPGFDYAREEVADLITTIRELRESVDETRRELGL